MPKRQAVLNKRSPKNPVWHGIILTIMAFRWFQFCVLSTIVIVVISDRYIFGAP